MRSIVRLLAVAKELWPLYLGIVISSVLVAVTGLATPFIIARVTDEVVASAGGAQVNVMAVVWLAGALLATDVANTLISNWGGYLGDTMAVRLRRILSTTYFAKLLRLPQQYFDQELTGTVISRLSRSITETTGFLNMFANNFFPMLITVGAVLVISATYSPWLTLLLIAIYPIFTWLTAVTSKRWQKLEAEKNVHFDIAGGRFAEVIGQIKVVKSFGQQDRELAHFAGEYDGAVTLTRTQSRWWHLMDVARRGALNLIFFGIYLIIFIQTMQGHFTVGQLVLLVQLVALARQPVMGMSFLIDSLQKAITGSKDFFAVLAEPEEDLPKATAAPDTVGADSRAETPATEPGRAPLAIEFAGVGFGYSGGEAVLTDVSFTVRPGERIAFVGESGGGKTTLVSLLLGLYRPDAGTIRVGGRGIDELGLTDLRAEVGVVFQEASLFSGTIAENIRYGRPEATDSEVIEAAQRANAHDFISTFPKAYDAEIGERGLKLSGGQKQRIAVARAMLKDAPILVLDEATSSLDSKSERLVQQGLEVLMADRTTLIVAHRLSTISSVDRIITLRDGRVDEIGTPSELAESGGIYAELLALQSSATKADRKRLQAYDILR
ncbi:MAG: ABC transporter ATP-binding protein [Propionibacteriaceae bacterium]|nr:ABC transporter ATP-binding protein [Micropruina sp.]